MKRIIFIFFILFVTLTCRAQYDKILDHVRWEFQEMNNKKDIQSLLEIAPRDEDMPEDILIRAYQAAATCRMAEFVSSPWTKLKFFNRGKEELENLIKEDKHVELIYLRMLLQLNVPGILNYNKEIDEDLAFFVMHLEKVPVEENYKKVMVANIFNSLEKSEHKETLGKAYIID